MVKKIEWMCRNCGKTERRTESMGRPLPGHCIRMDGKPHSWVKNRIVKYSVIDIIKIYFKQRRDF